MNILHQKCHFLCQISAVSRFILFMMEHGVKTRFHYQAARFQTKMNFNIININGNFKIILRSRVCNLHFYLLLPSILRLSCSYVLSSSRLLDVCFCTLPVCTGRGRHLLRVCLFFVITQKHSKRIRLMSTENFLSFPCPFELPGKVWPQLQTMRYVYITNKLENTIVIICRFALLFMVWPGRCKTICIRFDKFYIVRTRTMGFY